MTMPFMYLVTRPPEEGQDRDADYLFAAPESEEPIPGALLDDNPYNHPPLTFTRERAEQLAAAQNRKEGRTSWRVELAPAPCPSCGRIMWANDHDFCYPSTRERTHWRAGCNEHDFGCGFEVRVAVPLETEDCGKYQTRGYLTALEAWNTVQVYEYPSARYARVEHKGEAALEAELAASLPTGKSLQGFARAVALDSKHPLHFVARHLRWLRSPRGERDFCLELDRTDATAAAKL